MSKRPGLIQRVRNLSENLRALTLEGFGGSTAISTFTSSAGVQIEHSNALEISAVIACVRVLSDSIASLPLKLYERDGAARTEARMHPLYRVLHDMPNTVMTSFTFREVLMLHLALWGNFYAEIVRDQGGNVQSLWPIPPNKVLVEFYSDQGVTRRRYHVQYGEIVLSDAEVLHIPGLGYNGYIGLSPISLARDTLGLAKATELYGSKFFANDATPGGILTHPGNLKSEESIKRLKADWQNLHQSASNARRIAVLEEGMDFKQIGIPPEDSQFLETRKFQVAEIARIFRVPPHMIADVDRSTSWGTGIEQQTMGFVTYTLRPWLVRIEQAITAQLLRGREPERYYPEFSVEGLLRGDTSSRYQAYATARQWGWMSINEIRRSENMEPVPDDQGGDLYISPLNMAPASQVTQQDGERSAPVEQRSENRAAITRVKVARSFEEPLREAALKAVKRERAEVLEQVQRAAGTREVAELERWVNEYYRGEQPPAFVRENLEPVLRGMFRAVGQMAADEVSAPYDSAKFEAWQDEYIERFTWKWAIRSRTQLLNLLREHREDFEEFVTTRLDEWVERRPTKVSDEERVQAASEAARTVWVAAGFIGLRWVVAGDSCEFCTALNGTEVKMSSPFVEENGSVTGSDGGSLRPGGSVFTPPVHAGCNCTIVPV